MVTVACAAQPDPLTVSVLPTVVTSGTPCSSAFGSGGLCGSAVEAGVTVSVKLCTESGLIPFDAVMVNGNVPLAVGVPDSVAVPLWLSTKVTPDGSAPDSVIVVAAGVPAVVVTVNAPAWP